MHKYDIVLSIFWLSLLYMMHGFRSISGQENLKNTYKKQTSIDFDLLIFTQRWPLTACFVWKRNSESHSCILPKHEKWTIHGIWPTIYNIKGPEYCNKSMSFNASALAPIENELKENWIDIQNGSKPYTFWKHEWEKHGTCAVTIKALNSELKYFGEGLKLLNAYNMIDVLAKANILPGKQCTVGEMLTAVEKVLGKRCQITCATDEKTDESYVNEIRICFNKSLQLANCDGIYKFPTNCNSNKLITYPSYVPHHLVKNV